MTQGDVAAADDLRRFAGWNQTPDDWREMIRMQPDGCFVVEANGLILGTVTTIQYACTLAWIGMMLVHPDHRRRGIGRALMVQALEHLRSCHIRCIRLDATPAGYPLYEQLGFVPEWPLARWERPADFPGLPARSVGANVREFCDSDWIEVIDLDARAFMLARSELLYSLARRARKRVVSLEKGRLSGFGFLRPGARCDYIGPLICSDPQAAADLANVLLMSAAKRPVFWDIPEHNLAGTSLAERLGFTRVRPLTRMRLGTSTAKSDVQTVYGIADPAVG
jgi:GNAT superfamily N-acetyltransferase